VQTEPTIRRRLLDVGDHLLLLKGEVGRTVTRGDVVVFASPNDPKASFAKRVIGIGGDHLEILGHTLRLNGAVVPTAKTGATLVLPKITEPAEIWSETLDGRTYSILHNEEAPVDPDPIDVQVPPGSIYVLGDNRENSFDSRAFGVVQLSSIEGRVAAVWASFDEHGAPRWDRIGRVVR
jgi:signal peptidase I